MKTESIYKQADDDEDVNHGSQLGQNLFARFAYSPVTKSNTPQKDGSSVPGSMKLESSISGRKRKVMKDEEETKSLGMPITELQLDSQTPTQDTKPRKKARGEGSSKVKYYHHLKALDDCLANELDVVFCGINAGKRSSEIGHHFGNPTNHFWSCLYESGLTPRRLEPKDDLVLTSKYNLGLTNLCHRPSVEQNEIARDEFVEGVPILLDKLEIYKPKILCFVGLGIADIFKSAAIPSNADTKAILKAKAKLGIQPYKLVHEHDEDSAPTETLFYVVSSTSGRVVRYQKTDKVEQFKGVLELLTKIKNGAFDSSGLVNFSSNTLKKTADLKPKKEVKEEDISTL